MTKYRYIIFGIYNYSGKEFYCGMANKLDIAYLSANTAANMLAPATDTKEWTDGEELKVISRTTNLNYMSIHIRKTADFTPRRLQKLLEARI